MNESLPETKGQGTTRVRLSLTVGTPDDFPTQLLKRECMGDVLAYLCGLAVAGTVYFEYDPVIQEYKVSDMT